MERSAFVYTGKYTVDVRLSAQNRRVNRWGCFLLLDLFLLLLIRRGVSCLALARDVCYTRAMRTVTTKRELRAALAKNAALPRVLVPTMGALHAGHASLLRQARELAGAQGCVVASVFLNPTQFNQAEDLASYPRTPQQDADLCEACGVDILFMPDAQQMYCDDQTVSVHESALSSVLCGASRPGHFDGVCLVVSKLFNLVQPTDAIFGEKDYQQLAILRRMVRDLDFSVALHAVPIVREKDGLAVSSRNVRLSAEHRLLAPQLYAALRNAAESYKGGSSVGTACVSVMQQLEKLPGVKVDYVQMVDPVTLRSLSSGEIGVFPTLLAAAVFFGDVRLIDNVQIMSHS